ncbi:MULTISPECIES: enoyl-CoA hydratase/isomerase family protein [Haloferax]|uniref:Enoyl-CoA hydratase n=2 Tax=Haloferax gibbonsii TaxID=35746 RepID=A0A0K1IT78_HALGI|nr:MULTISPECIES: enoyl-CoA hydratase-related protein [Haloferax]AKU07518.1 enoyl-CoA hydratase [Haloferax gibbonsii]ELZ77888.1 enoyl-CoA hydratase [Haloferax gibbonsii ATCC 33959]RDZ55389.1 enoyl-CoA hydratase [Haloferax sp. Atlit-4N]REA04961.1 enoyl-CoA hydratase [Haloferax sp. Atlit-6N]
MTEVELDSDAVRLALDDGVATVTLDAPAVRNALTVEVTAGVREALGSLPDEARCVVLRGSDEAGAFCAGGDVNAMLELQADAMTLPEAVDHVVRDTADCVRRVYECDLPTVAAIDGPAVGAGGALAIACDLQLLREDASVGFGFRRVGLAVDSGLSYLLPRLVGRNVAMELVYTGEKLGPERALELGVVNRVADEDEFEAELDALTERIAGGPTKALTASKRLLRRPDDSIEAAIEHEASAQAVMFGTDDHAEGVESFMSRREPEFEGK